MKKWNLIFIFFLFLLIGLLIFFLPDIYKSIQKLDTPKINKSSKEKIEEEKKNPITIDSDIVKNITLPIMHNDKYNKESYYQKESIDINDFSNNDILYNAFLDLYDGYLVDNGSVGCTTESKKFDANYLKKRIMNIIGKKINYNLEDFFVPNINDDSKYIGLWKYNDSDNTYIFYGNCNKINNDTTYFELKDLYKVDSSSDNGLLYLYYHVGFVKVENNNFYIYDDVDYTNEVGQFKSVDGNINYDLSNFKTYKFTFKLGLCSYDNYCFYKGEWIND